MGYVANSTANAINSAGSSGAVDTLVTGYLRRKIKQKPQKKGDDVHCTGQRLWSKLAKLEPQLVAPLDEQARRAFQNFASPARLPQEMELVRASRLQPLPLWGRQIQRLIDGAYRETTVKRETEAYLFSHIDVHVDVPSNIDRLLSFGRALENAVVAHKEFVQQEVQRFTEPHFLAVMHNNKCKSEYAKWAKQCARDINRTASPIMARAALESYFWEKLYANKSAEWNQNHQAIKLDHLLQTLTSHRDLAAQVYREVSAPARLNNDLRWKRHILTLDYRIENIAETFGTLPPATSGRQVLVDLARMSNARSTGMQPIFI